MKNKPAEVSNPDRPATSSSLLGRAVRNSLASTAGTAANFVLAFVFAGLSIRYLGAARAGYFLSLQAVLGLNVLVFGNGLSTPAIRRIVMLFNEQDLRTARSVLGSVLTFNVGFALPVTLFGIFFFSEIFKWSQLSDVYRKDAYYATLLTCGGFLVSQVSSTLQSVYHARQRYDLLNGMSTLFSFLSGILGILVLRIAPSMTALAATSFSLSLIRVVCDIVLTRRMLDGIPWPTWNWREIRGMLGFGGWNMVESLGGFLFTNADRLILTTFLGSAAMPYYVVPQRLYSQVHTGLTAQSQFLFPMLSALDGEAASRMAELEDRLRWFIAALSGTAYVGVALVGSVILARIVNLQFAQEASLPLALMCLQGFLHAQMIVPYFGSWAIGKGAPNAIVQVLNGILVAVTAIILIPHFGYVGASLAQLWIGPIMVGHSLWIRRLMYPKANRWAWLMPYISPSIMMGVWLFIALAVKGIGGETSLWFYLAVVVGCISGWLAMWFVESLAFPRYERWVTLMRAIAVPQRWLKRQLVHNESPS